MELEAFNFTDRQINSGIKRGTLRYDEHGDLEKCCTRCYEWMPLEHEFWHSYNCKADNRKVVQAHCRFCECARKKDQHRNRKKPKCAPPLLVLTSIERLLNKVFC